MIYGNIRSARRYFTLHPEFKEIFDLLGNLSKDYLPENLSGENYKIIVKKSFADTSDFNSDGTNKNFEAHREYIDIHYCISGSEGFGFQDISLLDTVSDYNAAEDFSMHSGTANKLIMHKGDFCIVYPEDAHIPLMKGDCDSGVLKAIVKVKIEM